MILYLAHPHAEQEYGKHIQELLERDGFKVINPFDRPEQDRYNKKVTNRDPFSLGDAEELVEWDLDNIYDADAIVALYVGNGPFIGMSMEVSYATLHMQLPVVTLYLYKNIGVGVIHPWLVYLTEVVTSEEDLLKSVRLL